MIKKTTLLSNAAVELFCLIDTEHRQGYFYVEVKTNLGSYINFSEGFRDLNVAIERFDYVTKCSRKILLASIEKQPKPTDHVIGKSR